MLDAFVKDRIRHAEQFDTGEEWTVYDYYTEEPKSAKDTNRPHYQRLMGDIESGNVDTILFTEISRLSRSTRDFLELGEFLKEHEADFICLRHPELNTATPHGRALLTMLVAMMAFEREINAERSGISFVARSGRGLWTGGQLLGYDLDEKKGHLNINPAEKKVVQFIFDVYVETGSVHEVTKRCRQHGYKTKTYESRRGNTHHGRDFSYSSVKQALANLAYVGKKELGRPRQAKGRDGKWKLIPSKTEHKVIATECWKPIIEQDLFYKAQGMPHIDVVQRKWEAGEVAGEFHLAEGNQADYGQGFPSQKRGFAILAQAVLDSPAFPLPRNSIEVLEARDIQPRTPSKIHCFQTGNAVVLGAAPVGVLEKPFEFRDELRIKMTQVGREVRSFLAEQIPPPKPEMPFQFIHMVALMERLVAYSSAVLFHRLLDLKQDYLDVLSGKKDMQEWKTIISNEFNAIRPMDL